MNLTQRLEEVAVAIEEAMHLPRYTSEENHQQYVGLVKRSVERATSLKIELLSTRPLDRDNLVQLHRRLYEMRRELDGFVARLPSLPQWASGFREAHTRVNLLGLNLCRYGQRDLDRIQPGLAARLTEVGRNLHLYGESRDYHGGIARRQLALENLGQFARAFGAVVDGLPLPS